MTRLAGILACALAVVTAPACSGGDGGHCSGPEYSPCGGDVVGSWTLSRVCPSASSTDEDQASDTYPSCSSTNVEHDSETLNGVDLILDADGTYTRTVATTARWEATLDRACAVYVAAREGVAGGSLEDVCQIWENRLDSTGAVGSCGVSGDLCECDYTWSRSPDSGTYTVVDGYLLLSGAWEPMPYCVEGDELTARLDMPLLGQEQTWVVLAR